jgi:hypothetical protein
MQHKIQSPQKKIQKIAGTSNYRAVTSCLVNIYALVLERTSVEAETATGI